MYKQTLRTKVSQENIVSLQVSWVNACRELHICECMNTSYFSVCQRLSVKLSPLWFIRINSLEAQNGISNIHWGLAVRGSISLCAITQLTHHKHLVMNMWPYVQRNATGIDLLSQRVPMSREGTGRWTLG